MPFVDDPTGELAVQLFFYNYAPSIDHMLSTEVHCGLPIGTILAIMNPWFKQTADGEYGIRCDNPAHVVIIFFYLTFSLTSLSCPN